MLIGGSCLAQTAGGDAEEALPAKFFQVADDSGYLWQATGTGAITSGETQYLQSGLNLLIDGRPFAPTKAEVQEPSNEEDSQAGLVLTTDSAPIRVRRDLWFDTARSGVRVIDTFENKGSETASLTVSLRTTFPFGWQSLHDVNGDLLSQDPILTLDEKDTGMIVHFSASEGRHDLLFMVSSEEDAMRPRLQASTNSRELTFVYELDVPVGKSVSLLHWVLQRNLGDLRESSGIFQPFVQRGVLIRPRVDSSDSKSIANFAPDSIPAESTSPSGLRALLSLNQLTDQIGWHRRGTDIHWIGPGNQLSGSVKQDHVIEIDLPGSKGTKVAISKVAAVSGGGGVGRRSLVYLRDGQVATLGASSEGILWTPTGESESVLFDSGQGNLLLLSTRSEDGKAPAGATHFVQLRDGSVFAVKSDGSEAITCYNPWGIRSLSLAEINELAYISRDTPRHRILQSDQSLVDGFLSPGLWKMRTAAGAEAEIHSSLIQRIWKVGAVTLQIGEDSGIWLEFSEVPTGATPSSGGLFLGNNVIAGSLADETLSVLSEGSLVEVASAQIHSMSRIFDVDNQDPGADSFEIQFRNGDRIKGRIDAPALSLKMGEKITSLPIGQWIAYRSTSES